MSEKRTIHFHVGAHKTATTYMQSRLRANKACLCEAGVDFVDLWSMRQAERSYRKELKRLIERGAVDERRSVQMSKQLRKIVASRASRANPLIVVSYENVLGDYDLTRGDAPYPNAEAAMRHLAKAFPQWKLRIFLSIRSLDRFLESGYVQRVFTRRETRTFKQYLSQIDLASMSWMPAVHAIRSVVGRENMSVWEYENFVADEAPIWNALLARRDAEAALTSPAKSSNQSLSAKGLKYMRSINKVATPGDARKFRPFVRDCFGSHLGFKPPTLLDDGSRQQLIANYERDRMELAAEKLCEPDKVPEK